MEQKSAIINLRLQIAVQNLVQNKIQTMTTQVIIMNQIQIVLERKTIIQVIIMDRLQTVVTRKMTIQGISLINKNERKGRVTSPFSIK